MFPESNKMKNQKLQDKKGNRGYTGEVILTFDRKDDAERTESHLHGARWIQLSNREHQQCGIKEFLNIHGLHPGFVCEAGVWLIIFPRESELPEQLKSGWNKRSHLITAVIKPHFLCRFDFYNTCQKGTRCNFAHV